VLILTILGGGGGWFLGTKVSPKIKAADDAAKTAAAAAPAPAAGGEKPAGGPADPNANGIVQLDPITTNLAYPSDNWVRLEVALQFKGPADPALADAIHQDILAYIRTVSLQQIEGPRGFQYLRDDIQERVDLRSEGRVSKVMFRTFVIE
ncbi:MAG: flagellar basal body-associated FliL family protein, partial [Rhizobiaceae bacterium]|nr:flagellar basal body-associated FliL family protein [Rhizobiaceae bacterium]